VNSRARVEAALAQQHLDRPPAAAWGHTYREEWSPEALAGVTIARQRRYGWDWVKFQPRASCFAEAFGAEYAASGHSLRAPKLLRAPVQSLEDWKRLPAADASSPALADQVESIRLVARELGPDVPVVQTVFSPITVAGYLTGRDSRRAVRELRQHPEVVGPALDRIAAALVDFTRRSLAAGAAGIFYAISGYASADMIRREDYEFLLLPYDRRVLSELPREAWFNIVHLCGSHLHFELANELPAQVVSWSVHNQGNPSLRDGKSRSGRPVMGGVAQRTTLARGTPAEVRREVKEAIKQTGGEGLFVAPGCSVPPRSRQANLEAMMEAARAA